MLLTIKQGVNMFQTIKNNYKIILTGLTVVAAVAYGINNNRLALIDGVPVTPDCMYDANDDGKKDAFFIERTSVTVNGLNPSSKYLVFIDGNQLEKTVDGYVTHAAPKRIVGTEFFPKTEYEMTLSVGEFDEAEGIDAVISENFPDFGVDVSTELTNLKIPKW